ncbi:MAG: hypothetical protein ACFCVE_08460 [Phycisphaerae bacterium]
MGCVTSQPLERPTGAYFGPTDSFDEVVAAVNANNVNVETLYADGYFEAQFVTPAEAVGGGEARSNYLNGQVRLLYERPGNVRLVGLKDIAGQIFDLGANDELFWLILRGDIDTMWYGRLQDDQGVAQQASAVQRGLDAPGNQAEAAQAEDAQAEAAQADEVPIRPDLIIEVLGIGLIGPDLLTEPVPVMRFNNDADAYMLTWQRRAGADEAGADAAGPDAAGADGGDGPARWVPVKEIWYDRQTKLPEVVLLFGPRGRVAVRAYLSEHRAVEEAPGGVGVMVSEDAAPMVAGRYQLFFPETGDVMSIELEQVYFERDGVPNELSFRFPGDRAGVSNVRQVR